MHCHDWHVSRQPIGSEHPKLQLPAGLLTVLHSAHEDRGGALNYTDLPVLSDHDVSAIQCVFFRLLSASRQKSPPSFLAKCGGLTTAKKLVSTCPCIAAHASNSV